METPPPVSGYTQPSQSPYSIPYDPLLAQAAKDNNELRLLSMFHYIGGGLIIAFSCIFIVHIILGVMMETNSAAFAPPPGSNQAPPPKGFGLIFVVGGSIAIAIGWAMGIAAILSGRYIARRRNRTFSLVMAGILCLNMPIGTLLGVFTFIVLLRDSVRMDYERRVATVAG